MKSIKITIFLFNETLIGNDCSLPTKLPKIFLSLIFTLMKYAISVNAIISVITSIFKFKKILVIKKSFIFLNPWPEHNNYTFPICFKYCTFKLLIVCFLQRGINWNNYGYCHNEDHVEHGFTVSCCWELNKVDIDQKDRCTDIQTDEKSCIYLYVCVSVFLSIQIML